MAFGNPAQSSPMNIEDKPSFDTPFAWMGGEAVVRALADRFYDLMDMEPGFKALRDAHGSSLDGARDKLFSASVRRVEHRIATSRK